MSLPKKIAVYRRFCVMGVKQEATDPSGPFERAIAELLVAAYKLSKKQLSGTVLAPEAYL